VLSNGDPSPLGLVQALTVWDFLGLSFALLSLYALLRLWFTPTRALVGVLLTAALLPITFAYFLYQPWWMIEVGLLSLGLRFGASRRLVPLGAVVLLAALNRETGVFVPLAILLGYLGPLRLDSVRRALTQREVQVCLGYLALSAAVFGGLRLLRGGAPPADRLEDVALRNLNLVNLSRAGFGVALFLGAGWVFAVRGRRSAPEFIRQASRVVVPYLAVFLIWGTWREVRLLATLYPVLLPLVLTYCYPHIQQQASARMRVPGGE
jgi:hypothetical protein